jgi:glycosyltransferase involved in cell wall biosynthesis
MKFSVATPSFNQLEWLRLCIASVADQAEAQLEIEHVVQDAGTRGLDALAAELNAPSSNLPQQTSKVTHFPTFPPSHLSTAASGCSLHLISEPDGGMYDAINKAWHRASGDIISYLNTDEQYLPGTLAKVAQFFEQHPEVDLVFGDALVVDRAGCALAYRRAVKPSATHSRVVHLGVMSCTMFFRRSWLDRGFFFDPQYRAIGDAELVWRMLRAGARVGIIREPLAAFTITGQNLGANPKALAEAAAWRHSAPLWQRAAAPLLRLENWTRKALAGAYAKHPIDTALYTLASPTHRIPVQAPHLSHHWPG